ncbi:MAG: aldose epimerase [Micromonosporaceae bacterium]|nr:aldose epimerase [Micromonosporaceae bacterium]
MEDAPAPSGAQWTISYQDQQAVLVEIGGGVRRWRVGGVDLLDGYRAGELCPGGAGQVLAPWPNRIRDGRYSFAGVAHQLPLTEPDRHTAMHGLVRWLPWRLVDTSGSSVTCQCTLPAQPGYPWSLSLRTVWSLSSAGLAATHHVTNLAGTSAPFGLAVHPYLRPPDTPVADLRLAVPARSRLLTDTRMLPIGAAKTDGTDWDFTTPRSIGEAVLDTTFGTLTPDRDGGSTVTLTTPDGAALSVWADSNFHYWQVFTGDTLPGDRRRRAVAVEPMTCPPDAFRSGRDVVTLEPGATWHATWRLSLAR